MNAHKHVTVTVGDQELTFETGKIAKQASGSIVLKTGDTVILTTACASNEPMEGVDFLPLRVDYQERLSAAGKTPGGFIKRQGKPTERETLTCRLIDRPLRPLFPDGYYHDIQLISTVLSYDESRDPDVLSICANSAALMISDIPFNKAVGAVRVGMIDGKFVINPPFNKKGESDLDLVLAGTEDAVLMIEGYCDFLSEEQVIDAINTGHQEIKKICHAINDLVKIVGKEKNYSTIQTLSGEVKEKVASFSKSRLLELVQIADKKQREDGFNQLSKDVLEALLPEGQEVSYTKIEVQRAFKKLSSQIMRDQIIDSGKRCDGREFNEVRPISIEPSLLPRTHGSALFTRGETQAIAVCTLGGESMAQKFETLEGDDQNRFYLQYSFPPYSVGEVGRMGPPGRREVGHGKLAERSLELALPNKKDFPYTLRVESNITESNGSSSMASVCGGCIAMMDAGVPIKAPIAGIAMGLILDTDNADRTVILSDILGIEDALGDMDFKITGSKDGITAFQMDIKVEGITPELMKTALEQARLGRLHILSIMKEACPKHAELAKHAPRIVIMEVKQSKIATIIGPGGKNIRGIIDETGAQIDINQEGQVNIAAPNGISLEKAQEMIEALIAEAEVGKTYEGIVTKVANFGAFVEILPGKTALCPISEFAYEHIDDINTVVKEKQKLVVKVIGINDRGQIRASHKATLKRPPRTEGSSSKEPKQRAPRANPDEMNQPQKVPVQQREILKPPPIG